MAEHKGVIVVPKAEVEKIPVEKAFCAKHSGTAVLFYKTAEGVITCAPNRCAHMGFALSPDLEDAHLARCGTHQGGSCVVALCPAFSFLLPLTSPARAHKRFCAQAKLNLKTMTYECAPAFMASMGTKVAHPTNRPAGRPAAPPALTFRPPHRTPLPDEQTEKGTVQPQYTVLMNADGSATLTPTWDPKGSCTVC